MHLAADLGRSSSAWDSLHGTYAVAAAVRVPIFQGGRVQGRVLQADAQLKQQQAQVEDLRARIEYEVRSALLDVQAADDRVRVARSAADLAGAAAHAGAGPVHGRRVEQHRGRAGAGDGGHGDRQLPVGALRPQPGEDLARARHRPRRRARAAVAAEAPSDGGPC